jgi:ATP-dependent Lon protease
LTLIESTTFNGNGAMILTGNMGDIMKESISTAISWIKSNLDLLGLNHIDFSKKDFHIHVPDAAIPKDGPSAGITMTISLVKSLSIFIKFYFYKK